MISQTSLCQKQILPHVSLQCEAHCYLYVVVCPLPLLESARQTGTHLKHETQIITVES